MAKLKYERLNETKNTVLEDAKAGDVIKYDDNLYVVTDTYLVPSNTYRGILNISAYRFGEFEYIDNNADIQILKDAEITIKY